MGLSHPISIIGEDIRVPESVLPENSPNVSIRLMQWVTPFDDEPPYPLPITHFGIQRLVIQSEAGDNMMSTKVATLQSQGIKMGPLVVPAMIRKVASYCGMVLTGCSWKAEAASNRLQNKRVHNGHPTRPEMKVTTRV